MVQLRHKPIHAGYGCRHAAVDQDPKPCFNAIDQGQIHMGLDQRCHARQASPTQNNGLNTRQGRGLTGVPQTLKRHARIGLQHGAGGCHCFDVTKGFPETQGQSQALQHWFPALATRDDGKRTPL